MGRGFMMGVNLTYGSVDSELPIDISMMTIGWRIGGLTTFTDRIQLYPYSRMGLCLITYEIDESFGFEAEDDFGIFVGGGARLHVMLVGVLGAYADLSMDFQIFVDSITYSNEPSSYSNLAINFGFGLMAGF